MSDIWRRKTFYEPRVLIDVGSVLDSPLSDTLVCLTGAELEMLRNLMQYLHRRATFVSSYESDHYLCANNDDWDEIQAIVADLETKLMGCEELTALLEAMLTQLTCICSKASAIPAMSPALAPVVDRYLDTGTLQVEDTYGSEYTVADDRCAVAQLVFWQAWELLTEVIEPVQNALVDIILTAFMVDLALIIGTPILGIPVGVVLAVLWSLAEIAVAGDLDAVRNAYLANKDDLICALYRGLSFSYADAYAKAREVVAGIADLSPIDKSFLSGMMAPWAISTAAKAWSNQTSWALANTAAGTCDDCLEGDDWFAVAIEQPAGDAFLDHTEEGPEWVYKDVCGPILDGYTICGLVFTVVEGVGCECKVMGSQGQCEGMNITPNTSLVLENEQDYYLYAQFTHNSTQAAAMLTQDAILMQGLEQRTGPGNWRACWSLGWLCVGTRLVRARFIVYEKPA